MELLERNCWRGAAGRRLLGGAAGSREPQRGGGCFVAERKVHKSCFVGDCVAIVGYAYSSCFGGRKWRVVSWTRYRWTIASGFCGEAGGPPLRQMILENIPFVRPLQYALQLGASFSLFFL